jgi:peptidoglycan hydrolase-like protein with peptidoglycan-binding domain
VSRRRGTRRAALGGGAVVALGLTAGGVGLVTGAAGTGDDPPRTGAGAPPPATAEVTRGDLVDTAAVTGTLGYGDTSTLANHRRGTMTWVPAEGRVLTRGQTLWRVDTLPTVLMYGTIPMYRRLSPGVDGGTDVLQLEQNLRALGYTGFTVDQEYTSATAAAVKAWQDDIGLPRTGTVDADQVLFAPAPVRVDTPKLSVGSATGPGPALDVTGASRVVTVSVDASDQRLARKGAAVTVELPTGDRANGRISSVSTVAHAKKDDQGNTTGATIDVVVSLDAKALAGAAKTIDQSPVTVNFTAEKHDDVLSVPVSALLALREGGYGVQLVKGGTTSIVAVQVGMFADGQVEVSGEGIAEGVRVGVPSS